jgi:hypothetical protein
MKLYEIVGSLKEIEKIIDNEELTEEQEEKILAIWKTSELKFEEKAQSIIILSKNCESDIEIISEEIKRLQERKKILENKKTRLRKFLLENMLVAGYEKIKTALFSVTVRKATESLEFDENFSVESLPEEFKKITYTANKTAIKEAYEKTSLLPEGVFFKKTRSLLIK